MVVRDETGASAPTLLLLERLREYVELAARLRSAAPLREDLPILHGHHSPP